MGTTFNLKLQSKINNSLQRFREWGTIRVLARIRAEQQQMPEPVHKTRRSKCMPNSKVLDFRTISSETLVPRKVKQVVVDRPVVQLPLLEIQRIADRTGTAVELPTIIQSQELVAVITYSNISTRVVGPSSCSRL